MDCCQLLVERKGLEIEKQEQTLITKTLHIKYISGRPKLILRFMSLKYTKPLREGDEIKTNIFFKQVIFIPLHQ